jgi:hypothetical protein
MEYIKTKTEGRMMNDERIDFCWSCNIELIVNKDETGEIYCEKCQKLREE